MTDVSGSVVKPYSDGSELWSYTTGATNIANTTAVTLKAAVSGKRNYITGIQYQNTNATATAIRILSGSTVIWAGLAPANQTVMVDLELIGPLRGGINEAITAVCVTTGASVMLNAQGYTSEF